MRLLIAMMKHETNTFSPVPTPLARFRPLYGEAAIRAYRGTGTGLGAYLDLAEREAPRSCCRSPPARRRAARSRTPPSSTSPTRSARRRHGGGFDGIMLDLHGAMVTESFEDGEGELLSGSARSIRRRRSPSRSTCTPTSTTR